MKWQHLSSPVAHVYESVIHRKRLGGGQHYSEIKVDLELLATPFGPGHWKISVVLEIDKFTAWVVSYYGINKHVLVPIPFVYLLVHSSAISSCPEALGTYRAQKRTTSNNNSSIRKMGDLN